MCQQRAVYGVSSLATLKFDRHQRTLGTLGHCQLGTSNQSDMGTLGHCLLYIQRAMATSQVGGVTHIGTYWRTVNLCTQRAVYGVGRLTALK